MNADFSGDDGFLKKVYNIENTNLNYYHVFLQIYMINWGLEKCF